METENHRGRKDVGVTKSVPDPSGEPASDSHNRRQVHRLTTVLLVTGAIATGVFTGLGTYTFHYAEGGSYFSNSPSSCVNCHVMQDQYDGWAKGSHHAVATCNDCHAPHDSLLQKLYVKGVNGYRHSLAFTTGNFHEPIRITDFNRQVTEASCRHCHQSMVELIDDAHASLDDDSNVSCIRCHSDVGHP